MTKEDFSLKKDVLQIQKKVADLELTATELKESLSKFDTAILDELKQKIEDVEDLTMVEDAAVIELKKMLETTAPSEQPQEIISPQLEERLSSLEQKVSGITIPNVEELKTSITSALPAVGTTKLDEVVNEIRTNIDTLKSDLENKIVSTQEKFSSIESSVSQLTNIDMLKDDVKNYVLSSLPDNEWIKNELHSFKSYLDAEKVKLDSLMERVEKDIQLPLPEKATEELEKIRNDWMVNIAKIEAVEKFVENFSNEMNQLKPIIKKLETFEKLMDLQTEITEKLDTFKEYREHVEKAMVMNEDLERKIQREVAKLKNTEKMFSHIDASLSSLSKEMEKNKRETDEIVRPLEDKIETVTNNVKDFQDVTMSLDKRLDSIEKTIAVTQDDMSVLQGNLMGIENSLSKAKPDDTLNELVNKIRDLERKIEIVRTSTVFDEQLNEIVGRLVFLESRVVAMEGMIQDNRYAPIVVE